MFGVAALAALTGMLACGDPTGDLRNGAQKINTDFSLTVLDLGKSTFLTAQLLDEQGNALPGAITATSSNPAAVSITEVDTFRQGVQDKLKHQYTVTANSLDSVLITYTGGGVTGTSVVKVKPLSLPAVFSTATPNINDTVQVSAPPFKFTPATKVTYGGSPQLILSIAPDSSSVTFRVGNAGAGPISVQGAAPSYLLGTTFTLNSDADLTAGPAITALAGTDAIATAPEVLVPDSGKVVTLTDLTPFSPSADCTNSPGGADCLIYKLNLTGRDVAVSAAWNSNADIGVYFTDAAGNDTGLHDCDSFGNGAGGQPETCTITGLTGTYYMYVVTFAAFYPPPDNVDPTQIDLTLTGN